MAQQTAVEWFYQRILAEDIKEVFEQAKAMEKKQIEEAIDKVLMSYGIIKLKSNGTRYF
jgi:hypothetical protein